MINKIVKYRKKLIYSFLVIIFGQIFLLNIGGFGIQSNVYAADNNTSVQNQSAQERANEWLQKISFYKGTAYIIIYPLLFLAGNLVDNSFVYGEAFGFDVLLWNFWNVVKNLANFALGFIFIYKIFEILIKGDSSDDFTKGIKKLLISSLIAGLGIQASWFVMAAVIDLSTVAIYGIGGLPISVMRDIKAVDQFDSQLEMYVPKLSVATDLTTSDISTYFSNTGGTMYIAECEKMGINVLCNENQSSCSKVKVESGSMFLLGPKDVYYKGGIGSQISTEKNACHYDGQIYYFNSLYGDLMSVGWSDEKAEERQTKYVQTMAIVVQDFQTTENVIKAAQDGQIIQKGTVMSGISFGIDVYNKKHSSDFTNLSDVLDSSKTYLGVFSSLYSSLISSANGGFIKSAKKNSVFTNLLENALTLLHILALLLPLLAMCLVLIMRVFVIWLAIIMSPFIVLLTAFDYTKKIEKIDLFKYLKISSLLGIIFSPAVICLAVSMSAVFVRIINTKIQLNIKTGEGISLFESILGNMITIDVQGAGIDFAKLLMAIMGAGITWFILWAAIGSSALGKGKFIEGIKNNAVNALGTIPIVPIPTRNKNTGELSVKRIGLKTAFGDNGIMDRIDRKYATGSKQDEAVMNTIFSDENKVESSTIEEKYVQKFEENIVRGSNPAGRTQQKIEGKNFSDLSLSAQTEVINKINSLDESDRHVLGNKSIPGFVRDPTELKYKKS